MSIFKGDLPKKLAGKKISAFMTAPRYESTWARNMIEIAFKECNVPLVISQGVFYGQCMQRMLEDAIEAGVEIAITVDFDSIFTSDDVKYLISMMQKGEHEALASLQSRRAQPYPLFTIGSEQTAEFNGVPIEVSTAHFGLTGIDLTKLKDVPKPWFMSVPAEDGTWVEGKIDDDIYFWKKWRDSGNRVFVDAALSIGHLEEMISYFDEEGNHRFEYQNEWFNKNIMQDLPETVMQEEEG